MSNAFPHDYDLSKLVKVNTGLFNLLVTPRYVQHYEVDKYEPYSSQIVKNYLFPGETFLDIGAHYGYYSVLAGTQVSNTKIISVEPVKENFEILKKNLEINNIKNVELHNLAVSNKEEQKEFNVTEASDSAGFYEHPNTKSLKKILMQTTSIKRILKNRKVDFIKMDVEGHEIAALEEFEHIFEQNPTLKLLIEFNPKCQKQSGSQADNLIHRLEELGFQIYFIQESPALHFRYEKNKKGWENLLGTKSYCNLLCLPKNSASAVTFFSHSVGLGGAERSLLDNVTKIRSQLVMPHVVLPGNGPIEAELIKEGLPYSIIQYGWWASLENNITDYSLQRSFGVLLDSIDLLERINSHLIFTKTSVIPWGALCAKLLGISHIWEPSEFGDLDHGLHYNPPLSEVKKIINHLSDKVIFISQAMKNHYSPPVDEDKSEVLYYNLTIDEKMINEPTEKIYIYPTTHKFLIIGQIKKSKGQLEALNAALALLDDGLNIELAIVGSSLSEDDPVSFLQKIVPKSLSTKIHFKGYQSNPYAVIKQCDTLLVCSRNEAYGRVVVEAMYMRKLVIGAESGAIPEIISHEVNGLLYNSGDLHSLKDRMRTAVENKKLYKELSSEGYKWADGLVNKEHRVKKLAEIFRLMIKNQEQKSLDFYGKLIKIGKIRFHSDINSSNTLNIIQHEINRNINAHNRLKQINGEIAMFEAEYKKLVASSWFKIWQLFNKYKKYSLWKMN